MSGFRYITIKCLFITLGLLFTSPVHSQEVEFALADRLLSTADSLANISKYTQAILYGKRALNLYQSSRPVNYDRISRTYRYLGYYARRNGNYPEGERYLKRAIQIAQDRLPEENPEIVKSLNGYGILLMAKGDYTASITYFNRALDICRQTNCPEIAIQLNNLGIAFENLGNYSLAREYYTTALLNNKLNFGSLSLQASDNYLNLGTLSYKSGFPDKALAYFDTCLLIYNRILPFEHEDFATLYNNFGAVFSKKGDYKSSLHFLNKALRNYEFHLGYNHPAVANAYSNSGELFFERGDFDKALIFFQKSWSIRNNILGELHHATSRTCIDLGHVFLMKKDYTQSYFWFNKGLNNLKKNLKNPQWELVEALNGMGKYFESLGNYKDALVNFNQALHIIRKNPDATSSELAGSLARIGEIYLLQADYYNARKYINNALAQTLNRSGTAGNQDLSSLYRMLSLTYPDDEICALEYSDSALVTLRFDIRHPSNFEGVISHLELLKALEARGSIMFENFEKKQQLRYLQEAEELYNLTYDLIEYIKSTLEEPGSRQTLSDNFFKVYEQGILVKYRLAEYTGNQSYIEKAFQVAEKSNATLLMEAIRSSDAERFAGMPDSLLEKERMLKIEIAFQEKQKFNAENQIIVDSRELQKLNDWIFQLKNEYNKLLELYRVQYPKYFELKYNPEIVSVGKLRSELLENGKNLVSYFVGETNIFVFVLNRQHIRLKVIPKDFPLEAWIEEFRSSISHFNPAVRTAQYLNQKYAGIGYELYESIFKPIEKEISGSDVLIIPGGILGYLPFDALLYSAPEDFNNFDSYDFLIKKYNFSYSYSASFSIEAKKAKRKSGRFVAFAPVYFSQQQAKGRRQDTLSPLIFNIQEVRQVHALMKGDIFVGPSATSENFLQTAPSAKILHLAAHGKANDINSDFSYLAFSKDSTQEQGDEFVFVRNLYNLRLKANMVVLSACETGIGELKRGEGIISLARGFSFAGATGIVTTLWQIDDKASSDIMVDFYRWLKEGKSKNTALRQAKLDYINKKKGSNYTHPLFWSAFIPIGNMEPVAGTGWPWWAWVLVFGALLFFGLFGSRRIHQQPPNGISHP